MGVYRVCKINTSHVEDYQVARSTPRPILGKGVPKLVENTQFMYALRFRV